MSLNAPFGARCFMAGDAASLTNPINPEGLNAPFGARCFMNS
ncbi:hypothetical protein HMPREF0970_00529 [Schaalia odontolytica F0309]|uniref:Uncharacterized protein n=1 Tax=Schaalia odontolytica F0309 TaxID=649742 RepID=D4TX72_9ACTO|nr:hypothetical protein HMPREF0970_00529 [Schaalia odontolytica F0309]